MADIAVTATNVLPSADATISRFTAGTNLTAGEVVYQDPTDKTIKLADANGVSPLYNVKGITACGASTGQPVLVITADPALAIGGNVAAGAVVVLSATPGAIAPVADLASGSFVTVLGVGVGSNKIIFAPLASGVAVP